MHVEAGLRTAARTCSPFPEELNREVISCIAALHFAPTSTNQQNLVRENIPVDQIFVTGNTGIDALQWASALEVPFTDPRVAGGRRRATTAIVVVTAHRRENWGGGLAGIGRGRRARWRATHPDVRFVVPMHPNPRVRDELGGPLGELANVLLTEPLGYAEFARLLAPLHLVITDSGGIQEEAPSLGKPVLVARETTERTEGRRGGHAEARRHRPRRASRPRRSGCSTTRPPTREMADAREPLRRRARGRADRRRARALAQRRAPAGAVRRRLQRRGRPRGRRRTAARGAATSATRARARSAARHDPKRIREWHQCGRRILPFEGLPAVWPLLFSVALVVHRLDARLDDDPVRARRSSRAPDAPDAAPDAPTSSRGSSSSPR